MDAVARVRGVVRGRGIDVVQYFIHSWGRFSSCCSTARIIASQMIGQFIRTANYLFADFICGNCSCSWHCIKSALWPVKWSATKATPWWCHAAGCVDRFVAWLTTLTDQCSVVGTVVLNCLWLRPWLTDHHHSYHHHHQQQQQTNKQTTTTTTAAAAAATWETRLGSKMR